VRGMRRVVGRRRGIVKFGFGGKVEEIRMGFWRGKMVGGEWGVL
jgi:hypothetical protein